MPEAIIGLPTASDSPKSPVMRAESVSKIFGGTVALDGVTLDLFPGEIHSIVGENGAGKSTLTKILCGVYSPDTGTISLDGRTVAFSSPSAAQHAGVAIIYQEPTVFPDLSVAENVFIGRQPRCWIPPGVDRQRMRADAARHLDSLGVSIDPDRLVQGLSVAELQTVEMAAALTRRSRVLIVDEPTASLTPSEVGDLFVILRRLAAEGVAVLFIGHRLEEVFAIADRITVLRDGTVVSTGAVSEYDDARVIREMVGRSVLSVERKREVASELPAVPVLEVVGLSRYGAFADVSLALQAGRIVALAGLVGSGRTEIAQAIVGLDQPDGGEIRVEGITTRIESPSHAQTLGIAYVPEDRQGQGVALDFPISANISLPQLRRLSWNGLVRRGNETLFADEWVDRLAIRARSSQQRVAELSGGNQQKVVLAKWLATRPRVLILDEPTRGVDIGAKAEIHRLIDELVVEGTAVLLISSDLPEVLALADEILVVREGAIAGRLPGGSSAEAVMTMAVGNRDVHLQQTKRIS